MGEIGHGLTTIKVVVKQPPVAHHVRIPVRYEIRMTGTPTDAWTLKTRADSAFVF